MTTIGNVMSHVAEADDSTKRKSGQTTDGVRISKVLTHLVFDVAIDLVGAERRGQEGVGVIVAVLLQ